MKLTNTFQVSESELGGSDYDMFIGASGYETRATHAISRVGGGKFREKLVLGFTDRQNPQRAENDRVFLNSRCEIVPMSGDSVQNVRTEIRNRLAAFPDQELRILVDYTCMTRSWYAGIIEAIRGIEGRKPIECVFTYSPAVFSEPPEPSTNSIVEPIAGFCSLDVPEKPTALVIGLGYERSRALGLLEYIDPAVFFVFYTDPVLDIRFRDVVLANNQPVLAKLKKEGGERIFRHPLCDLQRTSNLLMSLCAGLREDHRVILAPLGVKPFSLLCLLIATGFRDLDVWRVSPGVKAPPLDRKPTGQLLALSANFKVD